MRKALFALALSAFSASASGSMAQSLPEPLKPIGNLSSPYNLFVPNYKEAPPLSSWQGFYIKPSVGYDSISFGGSQLHAAKGITLGVSGGYDFRYNNFVFGPVADLNYDFLRSDESSVNSIYGYSAHIAFDGSARAMAGYVWDRTLIYATGGYAFANVNVNSPTSTDSRTLSGLDGRRRRGISVERSQQYSRRVQARTIPRRKL